MKTIKKEDIQKLDELFRLIEREKGKRLEKIFKKRKEKK